MEIETNGKYYRIFNRLMRLFPTVESALDDGEMSEEFKNFIFEDFDGGYSTVSELKEDIERIVVPNFCDKILSFIYSTMIKFTPTDKVNGIPLSKSKHKRNYEQYHAYTSFTCFR